jgi:hypothetical protein
LVPISGGHFWDGAGGALLGAVIGAAIAIYVLFRTRKYDRELFRAQQSADAARRITSVINDLYKVVRSLRNPDGYPGPGEIEALHQAIQSVISVTRLDIPLLSSETMRFRIYHTRRRCEEAEEETNRFVKVLKRDYERGHITEEETRQEYLERDPLGPLASHLAFLVDDLDEFRAFGRVPRRETVNPPQARDVITILSWAKSRRPCILTRSIRRIAATAALVSKRLRWRLGVILPWLRRRQQSSGLESLKARALAAAAQDAARLERTQAGRAARRQRKLRTRAASEVERVLGVKSLPKDWTVRLESDDVGPLERVYAEIKGVQLRRSLRRPWVEVGTDGDWSQLTLVQFGRALQTVNSWPRPAGSAEKTQGSLPHDQV